MLLKAKISKAITKKPYKNPENSPIIGILATKATIYEKIVSLLHTSKNKHDKHRLLFVWLNLSNWYNTQSLLSNHSYSILKILLFFLLVLNDFFYSAHIFGLTIPSF